MDDEKLLRYSRQIMLPQVDIEGQARLEAARVVVVGLGGLGSPVAMYLAAAGVGTLHLCDDDHVEISNLQRQIIHREASLGQPKVDSAAARIGELNSEARVVCHQTRMSLEPLAELAGQCDLVIDCTDSFASRQMANRATIAARRPLVFGAAIRFEGQVGLFRNDRGEGPCYACIYGRGQAAAAQTCTTNGIMAPVLGVIGSMQALTAIRCLLDIGATTGGQLQLFDGLLGRWETMEIRKNPHCDVCA